MGWVKRWVSPSSYFSQKEEKRFSQVSEPTDRDLHSGPRSSLVLQHCKMQYISHIYLFG